MNEENNNSTNNQEVRNLIIVGSGPAGLTAAIYAARANLNPILIAGVEYGGQLMTTTMVENFPGFKDGIMGPELMDNMIHQAKKHGTEFVHENAKSLKIESDIKIVKTDSNEYRAKSIIIATGSSSRKLGVKGENEYWGKGVSTCATCDAPFYKDKIVAVVGGGDSAMEESTFISKFASKVYIIHRRDEFKASKFMQKKVFDNEKIEILWNKSVEEIQGETFVNNLKLKDTQTDEISDLTVDGIFLAIGHVPNTEWLNNAVDLDEKGYIKVSGNTNTSSKGVFVAGDIKDYQYQQAVTAAGMGCMSALDAEKFIEMEE